MCNFNASLIGEDFLDSSILQTSDPELHQMKKAHKVYEQDANLLEGIGEAQLTDEKFKLAGAFICKLYNQVTDTSDEARDLMLRT
jgi:hypothetical protein